MAEAARVEADSFPPLGNMSGEAVMMMLRAFIHSKRATAPALVDAVIEFAIVGDRGGLWTLDLRQGGSCDLVRGWTDNPDLKILLAQDFLPSFVSGDYDMEEAIANNKMGLIGKKIVLINFFKLAARPKRATQPRKGLSEPPRSAGFGLRRG